LGFWGGGGGGGVFWGLVFWGGGGVGFVLFFGCLGFLFLVFLVFLKERGAKPQVTTLSSSTRSPKKLIL